MDKIMNIIEKSILFDKKIEFNNTCDITNIDNELKENIQNFGLKYSEKPIYSEIYKLMKQLLDLNQNIMSKNDNISKTKINPLKNTLILFYSKTCPACILFMSEWKIIMKQLNIKYNTISIHCKDKKYFDICNKFNIVAYPTLKFIGDNQIFDYIGDMNAVSIINEFAKL
jgi:thiol-disulfide isomerase/thioredoxin